ncbi:MAG: cytochrome-c oxidase, cbb3-type subunit I [Gammaproteobacteria bacterium]
MNSARPNYDDRAIAPLVFCAMFWALAAMGAGVWLAAELVFPALNFNSPWLSFGRLRTIHTNAAVFGFGGSALMAASLYSVQRTCRATLFAPQLGLFVAAAWQVILVFGAFALLSGVNQGKEYAELPWIADIFVAAVWVCYAAVFFGTLARRTIRPIYVSNWFFAAFIIVVAMLHIVNSLAVPLGWGTSIPVYAGAQDAIVQWWYGHNAVGFFLTGGFLGMMYYFLPKITGRPIWSYRISILAFWSFTFTYIWAGPHHLHYNAVPDWVQSLGVAMSLILLAPSWGTMINGVMTVSGAWHKLKTEPALKFIALSLAFYGLATFEGPMMAIRSVNAISHFTEWTIGHVHSGALGWNAFVAFGALYYLAPVLAGRPLYSARLTNWHFGMGLAGVVLYMLAMWGAGITQGLLWLSMEGGEPRYGFMEILDAIKPYYIMRLFGGILFFSGTALMAWNLWKTFGGAPVAVSQPQLESESESTAELKSASEPADARAAA